MFSRFFESNQDKVRRLRDACPDFAFSGWGRWYAWDQALLGYPVCRLFESEREAKQYQSAVFPDSNTFNLRPRPYRYMGRNDVPVLPSDFPAWVSLRRVMREGPLIPRHLYRHKGWTNGPDKTGWHTAMILEFIRQAADEYGSDGERYTIWEFRILHVTYTPSGNEIGREPDKRIGAITKLGANGGNYRPGVTYFSPPEIR